MPPSILASPPVSAVRTSYKKRAALHLCIFTCNGWQTKENPRRQLRQFIDKGGYRIDDEFGDHESGRKGKRECAAFAKMSEAAETRQFDVLIFWSREGIRKTISYL